MKKYIPSEIEPKWQERWKKDNFYTADLKDAGNKYYVLVELPYTSGDLHIGHWFTFTMGDILARFKRSMGFNVLYPNGFDAFGLPGENAAIKQQIHPRDWTYANIKRMKEQFKSMGASIDWEKTAVTAEPEYYKWNQWVFLKMFEKGIAYRGKARANWCPKDATVLADENIEEGKCWRCGSEVTKKEVDQWFFKLTAYADRLLWNEKPQADWPKPLRVGQNSWIGKSEGMEIDFPSDAGPIKVYTVYPETIYGATYMVLAPEYPLVSELIKAEKREEVEAYTKASAKKSELERKIEEREKTGVFTGSYCVNPVNGKKIPVWIADYVIASYGTGAVMGVPGQDMRDFEFAEKFGLDILRVIGRDADDHSPVTSVKETIKEGWMVNSGEFNGLKTPDPAKEKMIKWLIEKGFGKRKTQYHLHDWSISRQRYWGTPIPIIHCPKCGMVPVPYQELPVELPYDQGSRASRTKMDYTPRGKPPLATAEEWVNVKCPKCGDQAKRDTETMDGFVDNSWYFYRYLDQHNSREIFDRELIAKWLPLEIYIGGAEHSVGHTLYSRFFTKFFHDLGLVDFEEYAKKRVHHGVILGPDGARMSKSRGNVVNPDIEVKKYGADAIRLYLMFLGPFDIVAAWNTDGVNGVYHFLQRVWGLQEKIVKETDLSASDLRIMHKTIKKVTLDIEQLKFNTAIAGMMEWLNHLSRKEKVTLAEYSTFLLLLAPFAPHITEELWEQTGKKYSVHKEPWPEFDSQYLKQEQAAVPVQINGKVRELLMIQNDLVSNREVVEKMAMESEKIKKFLKGKTVKKIVYIEGKILSLAIS